MEPCWRRGIAVSQERGWAIACSTVRPTALPRVDSIEAMVQCWHFDGQASSNGSLWDLPAAACARSIDRHDGQRSGTARRSSRTAAHVVGSSPQASAARRARQRWRGVLRRDDAIPGFRTENVVSLHMAIPPRSIKVTNQIERSTAYRGSCRGAPWCHLAGWSTASVDGNGRAMGVRVQGEMGPGIVTVAIRDSGYFRTLSIRYARDACYTQHAARKSARNRRRRGRGSHPLARPERRRKAIPRLPARAATKMG